ncbi:TPA: hypothetical protein HL349_24280 [Escherichia coli]|uniref:hypothetical protein n=1 Tax=Escherichia coli TaxID=562 RepID=UPI0013C87132|nr:hypothetical protein [Escherichia coli]MBM7021049.1 hypothetical protein [Escherichia coli]MBM7039681.1 hypothetical protein [Escherichia coli]MDE7858492.1 hypothetical protein [Escherichia coli]MDJ1198635.1 hypothetical protein [Escherichia coli]NGE69574.1 hypothetical protein [Escherichia coli]
MFVLIAGVNVRNEYYVNRIAGYAGRAVEFIDETTRKIDLLNDIERSDIGINDADIFLMLKAFVEMGFKISLHK